jgi:hypothetical protein
MMQRFFVVVLLFMTDVVGAQRLSTVPDLSALTRRGSSAVSLDPKTGFVYANFTGDRAMGVGSSGLARVSPTGVIDAYWQPTGMSFPEQHVVAASGDVYVVSRGGSNGSEVLRYSGARSGEPLSRYPPANSAPSSLALATGGDPWVYVTTSELSTETTRTKRLQVNRIDTRTGTLDSQWAYDEAYSAYSSVATGSDGSVFLIGQNAVARLSTSRGASLLWQQRFTDSVYASTPDLRAGLFVRACKAFSGCTSGGVVSRFTADGVLDASWDGAAVNRAMAQSYLNRAMLVLGDSLFVDATIDRTPNAINRANNPFTASVARFDLSGKERARWVSVSGTDLVKQIMGGFGGKLLVEVNGEYGSPREARVLDVVSLVEERPIAFAFGQQANVSEAYNFRDFGSLFIGKFDVWYGGQRYQNALRLRADGLPDTGWMAKYPADGVFSPELTDGGLASPATATLPTGETRTVLRVISLVTGDVTDWPVPEEFYMFATGVAYSQGVAGGAHYYAVDPRPTPAVIRRVSASTGVLDAAWSIALPAHAQEYPAAVRTDLAGGLWLYWKRTGLGDTTYVTTIERFDLIRQRLTQSIATQPSQTAGVIFQSTATHVYIGTRRYDLTKLGALDPSWDLARSVAPAELVAPIVTGRYLYYDTPRGLRRAALGGDGSADSSWIVAKPANASAFVIKGSDKTNDEVDYVLTVAGPNFETSSSVATTRNALASNKVVVEYFNRDAKRYFMTGRASEQATLDALPASFQRTGMSFSAKSSEYRDVPEQPICRFYAAPESGGSNTHFYGSGDDCAALNTVSQLRFEGFDFAAIKPTNATCPAAAPNAVHRLFNNQSATNQGNHRYVVSTATKSRMIAQGWIDEGVVFCSTSVTDATP